MSQTNPFEISHQYTTLHFTIKDEVVTLTLDRPKAMNAINETVLDDLHHAIDSIAAHLNEVRCIIITGAGKAFVAGADIIAMQTMEPEAAFILSHKGHQLWEKLEQLPVPVLAAVNGFALGGGCELALACDIIYASSKAKFGQPEVNLGLMPGFGGTVRLPRKIGINAANHWLFTGGIVSAMRAKELGLVYDVVEPEDLLAHVESIAKHIATRGPLAVAACKKATLYALSNSPQDAARAEEKAFSKLFSSDDMREGTSAFIEKRAAQFYGK